MSAPKKTVASIIRAAYERSAPNIRDDRADKSPPAGYVIGWGGAAEGRSLYAIAVASQEEAVIVLQNFQDRPEMKRSRFVLELPRLKPTDHLTIADRSCASRWYVRGAFAKGAK